MNPIVRECYNELCAGATLVTATNRLARSMQNDFDQMHVDAGDKAWAAADILPWSAWIRRGVQDIQNLNKAPKHLLSSGQEELLWQTIVRASGENVLLDVGSTARKAMDAWRLVHDFNLDLGNEEFQWTKECRLFVRWSHAFNDELRSRNALSGASLVGVLRESLAEAKTTLGPIIFAGFIDFTPAQSHLLEELRRVGFSVRTQFPERPSGRVSVSRCLDTESELLAAASSCRKILMERPEAKIAVVLPRLGALRRKTENLFREVLTPTAVLDFEADASDVFHISLGEALSAQPMIRDALNVLSLGPGRLGLMDIDTLLLSPFLQGSSKEAAARAELNAKLRRMDEIDFSWKFILREVERHAGLAGLKALLVKYEGSVQLKFDAKLELYEWAGWFSDRLNALGFANSIRGSKEALTWQAWQEVLAELSELSAVSGDVTIYEALGRLQDLCEKKLVQPPNRGEPVQIMGMFEAVGETFDELLLLDMQEDVLPQPLAPNPFLPLSLQREGALPHSNHGQSESYARRVLAELCSSAQRIVLSYAASDEGRELRPSPLIREYPVNGEENTEDPARVFAYLGGRAVTESLVDAQAPKVPKGGVVKGGTSLLLDQAACPFRAFAKHRLGARVLEEPLAGLSPSQRGTLVHEVLQNLWEELKSFAVLEKLSKEEREETISRAVDRGIEKFNASRPASLNDYLASLERKRLQHLLDKWLDKELERQPFEIHSLEKEMEIDVGELQLKGVVDRIDKLPEGGLMIIDYKTGEVSVRKWLSERPEDPQLPIYALAHKDRTSAVAFAQVKRGKNLGFSGVARKDGFAPGVRRPSERAFETNDWGKLLEDWKVVQEKLAQDFVDGRADVDPKKDQSTCRYCGLEVLCRVHDRPLRLEDE
ncbi:MAG: hypothetical protein CMH60_05355 [Myxococcales bacterium]|nr:hypothetical protein [Myxococcales bacterium]